MLVLNLVCAQGHPFEGWFGSSEDYESQQQRQLLSCPLCGHAQVQRLPSAPRLNVSHLREQKSAPGETQALPPLERLQAQLQQLASQAVAQVLAQTEDVGERFAEEARRIHYGETQERAIRGQATQQQAESLVDEGIAVLQLPASAKNSLQ